MNQTSPRPPVQSITLLMYYVYFLLVRGPCSQLCKENGYFAAYFFGDSIQLDNYYERDLYGKIVIFMKIAEHNKILDRGH